MLRIPEKVRTTLGVVIPAALLAAGLFAGPLISAEWRWRTPILTEVEGLSALDPVRALPRTEAVLATLEAQQHLARGRAYSAWESLQPHVDLDGGTGHAVNLLAARAASEWGGWSEARSVLADRPWLASTAAGEGLLLLARAEEELGNERAAAEAYRRYLGLNTAREVAIAGARLAALLSELGEHVEAARAYETAAAAEPEVNDWLRVLQLEHLVAAGDPLATALATSQSGGSAPARLRRVQLEAEGWITSAETNRAIARLDWEARVLTAAGAPAEAARLDLDRARLLRGSTDPTAARTLLRDLAADPGIPGDIRREAAERLGDFSDLTAVERLSRADAFEAAARPGLAARALEGAFEAGLAADGQQRLRLARLYYDERDYSRARPAFQRAAELLVDSEQQADAELHAARSLFRTSSASSTRQSALAEMQQVVERYPGTAAAGTAVFLLGDEARTNEAGLAYYRRAAEVTSSPYAREALYRAGDRSLRLGDTAAAIRAWEDYVGRYPRGGETAQVAYEVGKLHLAAGRRPQAEAMFTAATRAEPVSYYAVRAAERLGINSLDHLLADPEPWIGLASEPGDAAAVLRRLDRLEALGLDAEWQSEYQSALRNFESKPLAKLVLAEGLRDRHQPNEAIRLGWQLLDQRDGVWDERLLRVVFPFLYRDLIVAESRKQGVDPFLYAGLVRQESAFRSGVKSWVGATGLGQIMPATGRWLAPTVGIRDYRQVLLEVPEVNLRMGTKYLGDLLRRYDGAVDLALAGYNAGPGRADRWRRQFNYGRDVDAFRDAIPFDETRNYVRLVVRNAAIYERLYGGPAAGGGRGTD